MGMYLYISYGYHKYVTIVEFTNGSDEMTNPTSLNSCLKRYETTVCQLRGDDFRNWKTGPLDPSLLEKWAHLGAHPTKINLSDVQPKLEGRLKIYQRTFMKDYGKDKQSETRLKTFVMIHWGPYHL